MIKKMKKGKNFTVYYLSLSLAAMVNLFPLQSQEFHEFKTRKPFNKLHKKLHKTFQWL